MSEARTWISDFVQRRWTEVSSGSEQKRLAAAIHDAIERHGERDWKFPTVEQKLSKFLNGDVDAEKAFFEKPERLVALAGALGLQTDALTAERERSLQRRPLILDHTIPDEVVAAIKERWTNYGWLFRVVDPPALDDPRALEALRNPGTRRTFRLVGLQALLEAAKRATSEVPEGKPLLVLAETDLEPTEGAYLSGAGVSVDFIRRAKRGVTLRENGDLLPLPPPAPVPATDKGRPVFKIDDETQKLCWNRRFASSSPASSSEPPVRTLPEEVFRLLHGPLEEARLEEREPFLLDEDALALRLAKVGLPIEAISKRQGSRSLPSADEVREVLAGGGRLQVFWKDGRWFAFGPGAAEAGGLLGPEHPDLGPVAVEVPPWAASQELKRRNPLRLAAGSLSREVREWREETGLDASGYIASVADLGEQRLRADAPAVRLADDRARTSAATAIRDLIERDVDPEAPIAPEVLLLLDRMHSAPFVTLKTQDVDLLHAYVDLGAGRTMRIRISSYSDHPAPLQFIDCTRTFPKHRSYIVDTGDRVVAISEGYCDLLEGTYLPARHRRAEEAKKADEDDD